MTPERFIVVQYGPGFTDHCVAERQDDGTYVRVSPALLVQRGFTHEQAQQNAARFRYFGKVQ